MDQQFPSTSNRSKMIALIFGALFVLSLVFGLWAFTKEQDYKKNVDAKVAAAVASAKKQQAADDKAKYDEEAKQPYKTFSGPTTYGTISFSYPKNWSAYVDQSNQSEPINSYYYPDAVPGLQSATSYPLRVELVNTDYSQAVNQFTSAVREGSVRSTAYIPPKLKDTPNVQPGVKLDGAISKSSNGATQQGSMVIIKVRDKTLEIYTETPAGLTDFNNVVLPSLTFVP